MPFEELSDLLDLSKWERLDLAKKENFHEYQVMRQHKQIDPTTYRYLIQTDAEDEPKSVDLHFTIKDKDPMKDVGTAELRVEDKTVVGIDLEGDCYQLKK